jgi:predicted AAA+ superfamily ATPase
MSTEVVKAALLEQVRERDVLLAGRLVEREGLETARKLLEAPLAKIITGPRRAGKSVFAHLLLKGTKCAWVNLDDERLAAIREPELLLGLLHEIHGEFKTIFIDEIQNLPGWELFANRMLRGGYNVVLSGSNAQMLSSELATALTGRHLAIEVLPFSFREYVSARDVAADPAAVASPEGKGRLLSALSAYLSAGGYPDVVVHNLEHVPYTETLVDSILMKEVVRRYKVRQTELLYGLARNLATNMTREYTARSLKRATGATSLTTVQKYLGYLQSTYLFMELKRFSYKMSEQDKASRKAFLVDNGLFASKAFRFSADSGRLLENAVFVECARRGNKPSNFGLYYYRTKNGREVDFLLRKEGRNEALVQACFDLSDPKTADREAKALVEASEETGVGNLSIISWDTENELTIKGRTVHVVPLWKWLVTE